MNLAELTALVRTMLSDHWFWGLLTLAVLVWYSTVTIYVGIRGALDIQEMLRKLADQKQEAERK